MVRIIHVCHSYNARCSWTRNADRHWINSVIFKRDNKVKNERIRVVPHFASVSLASVTPRLAPPSMDTLKSSVVVYFVGCIINNNSEHEHGWLDQNIKIVQVQCARKFCHNRVSKEVSHTSVVTHYCHKQVINITLLRLKSRLDSF